GNVYRDNIQEYVSQATAANYNQGNTSFRPKMVANQIRPPGFPPHQNNQNNFNQNRGGNFNQSNFNQGGNFNQGQLHRPQVNQPPAYQALAYQALIPQTQSVTQTNFESYIKANDVVLRNMQSQGQEDIKGITTRSGVAYQGPPIPTPSKVVKQGTEVTKDQVQTPSSQSTAPVQPPVIQSDTQTPVFEPVVAPALIGNKEKLGEMARTSMNEHCSEVILNKLPRKHGDPDKFLIPCEFPGMDECLALADLGASINLMPLSMWEGLSLLELTPTCMTLELTDRSVSKPIGIAKDFSVKVGTGRALIDVHKGELTLRIRNKAISYNLDQTVRYSANYNQITANKIDVICEMYSQEVLGFFDVTTNGNPTPYDDPIVSTTSPTLTPFGDSNFLLFEEADAFLGLEDDPNSPEFNPFYYEPEGDILLLEAILNSEPLPPLLNHKQYMPLCKKELKVCEAKTINLPLMNLLRLGDEEKSALIKVLKSYKRAIAWKLSGIQGINLEFCTHKIRMEEDYKPAVQHQRRVNPKIHDVIKKEVEKLLDAGLIYPISDSPWVSPLNEATRKDHFPLPFMDHMLERLARNEYYCFLDGFSGYFQIPIDPRNQEKTTFTCPYSTFAYRRIPFGLCNALGTFQRCMLAIFHDMVEKTMKVFMDDFLVFRNSFENCLSRLDKMLQRCEDANLSLNCEKRHFMVKGGIVLGHKISKNEIEVDRAKVDVIAKLPHPTTIKGIRSFLGHASFYRRFIQDFFKISRPMILSKLSKR
nr:reverse transcriptase domain-containing protein [Tanacetum cinerariifolium]